MGKDSAQDLLDFSHIKGFAMEVSEEPEQEGGEPSQEFQESLQPYNSEGAGDSREAMPTKEFEAEMEKSTGYKF